MTKRNQFILVVLVITSLMIAFLSNDLYLPSMPLLTSFFHVSSNIMQITVGAWFAGSMTLQLILGPLSDSYGRKPILIISVWLLLISSLICALAQHIGIFIMGRYLQGVAASGIMVVSYAAVHEGAKNELQAAKLIGYVYMISASATLAGPLIGGYVSSYFGWSMNFYIVVFLSIINLIAMYLIFPESNLRKKPFCFIRLCKNYSGLLKDARYVSTVLTYSFMMLAGGAFLGGIAFVMVNILHYPVQHVGYAISPLLLLLMLPAGFTGHLARFITPTKIIFIAMIMVFGSMLGFVFTSVTLISSLSLIIIFVGIYYFCFGLAGPHLNNIALSCGESNRGAASACFSMAMMLGCTIGSFLLSVVYNNKLWSLSIVMFGAVFLAFLSHIFYLLSLKELEPCGGNNEK